jgi:hypothetical protein
MNDRTILEAVALYHAKTTPDAVSKTMGDFASRGVSKSAEDVLWSAMMALIDTLDALEEETK